MADKIIQWHPGFAAAINLEFAANRQDLIYEREYNLNTKPLVIDLLVIKKKEEVQMENKKWSTIPDPDYRYKRIGYKISYMVENRNFG